MADLKTLKHLLDLQDPSDKFDMTAPENLMALPSDEEEDPSAFEPAIEEPEMPMAPRTPALATPEEIAKIQAIPLPEAQKSIKADPAPAGKQDEAEQAIEQAKKPSAANILAELQKAREEQNRNLTLLQAGNQIAQAMAAGYGGKIGDGSDIVKSLRDQADQPIKDHAERIKNEEDDANSDVSKFMRENAYALLAKINPNKKYDLENMTANQLKKAFGNKLMSSMMPAGGKANNRYVTIQEPDGTIRSKLIDINTGDTIKDLGLAGYAYGVQIDPVTGQPSRVSKSNPFQQGVIPGASPDASPEPGVSSPKKEEKKMESVGDYRANQVILPKEWDNVVTRDKEGFEKQNGDKLKIISSLKGVESLVDEATRNPNAAAALGGIIGSFFEPGKLTDEDAKRYVQQTGLMNKYGNIIKQGITGKIDKNLASDIKKTARAYYDQMDKIVRSNAEKYSKATKAALINGKDIDNKVLADFYYQQDEAAPKSNKVRVRLPDGSTGSVPKEKLKDFLKDFPGSEEIK
jgi:hypothetical protein